ncbi:MAG: radical SAM family heme chaperone HemW [Coriobacteriia bacterium]|nr:radical SAM family heme chaperone HemW [Coriobacteriia bacterium]
MADDNLMPNDDLALYIHVPFCAQRCNYCDFCSSTDVSMIEDYFEVLITHISSAAWLEDRHRLRPVTSIYFGGGTPSLSHIHLISVLEAIRNTFELSDDCEITLEANPESFRAESAADLAAAGFTRVSLGVQSLEEDQLATLGRIHNVDKAFQALHVANGAGLRVSADLMLGLPSSEESNIQGSGILTEHPLFDELLSLVGHVSVYPLTVEEGTVLQKMEDADRISLPCEDEVAAQVIDLEQVLARRGFTRYEISSYARPGQESRQNLRYWQGGNYLGFGVSAASMTTDSAGCHRRFVMYDDVETFLADPKGKGLAPAELDVLTFAETQRESIMLALRTRKGVSITSVEAAGLAGICRELVEKGLLEVVDGCYRCTQQGWLLANIVFAAIWVGNT